MIMGIVILVVVVAAVAGLLFVKISARRKQKRREQELYKQRIEQARVILSEQIEQATTDAGQICAEKNYIAESELETFMRKYQDLYAAVLLLGKDKTYGTEHEQWDEFESLYSQTQKAGFRTEHNTKAKKLCKEHCAEYFDQLFAYPLDEQQRDAIVTLADNTLVVSAAGSGKTSTIIGRTRYLVDQLDVSPNNILLITYTRKAAGELRDRLGYEGITCSTFHRLALDIIAEHEGYMPTICKPNTIQQIFYDMLNDYSFKAAVVQYLLLFRNATKDEHEYMTPAEMYADRRKYGIQAPFADMDGKIIYTRSEQELIICNILAILGVQFRYEEPYEVQVQNNEHQQYRPDFSIHYTEDGKSKRVYLEHFAVDNRGFVPRWFGQDDSDSFDSEKWNRANIRYRMEMTWKRKVHDQFNTKLIETTSAEFYAGDARIVVRRKLQEAGVPLHPKNMNELYQQLISRDKYVEKNVLDLIEAFINLMKANQSSIESILEKQPSPRTSFILTQIIQPVYKEYCKRLREVNEIDFTDAIVRATQICERHHVRHYDYIQVDEFQDISIDRYRFLLALRSGEKQSKLFCVGDDWQSIYRFSGSDMSLFSRFEDFFGSTERCNIESTHRYGEPLVEKSSAFIKQNPIQVQKDVIPMPNTKTELTFHKYIAEKNGDQYAEVRQIVSHIPMNEKIYLLGRYTFDAEILNITDNVSYDDKRGKITVLIDGREIPFLTIHSSKGLEADHVILLNCNEGNFPSDISDDPVLSYVLSKADEYPDAEERRVFYVGITRARKHTYVMYDAEMPSPFVTEFVGPVYTGRHICPQCHNGYLYVVKRGTAKNGNDYECVKCSNKRAGCDYFKTIFVNDRDFGTFDPE